MHGENAEKRNDYEWYGKRPLSHYWRHYKSGINRYFKRLLHKKERQLAKKDIGERLKIE